MKNYRYTEGKYNIQRYLENYEVIQQLTELLKNREIVESVLIDIINSLADFLQYNDWYIGIDSFSRLTDEVLSIIEYFNENNSFEEEVKYKLVYALEEFSEDLKNGSNIKIYFCGKDKYNILKKSINQNIRVIDDIKTFIKSDKKHTNFQINILILSEETAKNQLDFNLYFNDVIYYDKLMNYIFDLSERMYYENYDYNYLLKSLEKAKSKEVRTLVVGNSYPLTGIDVSLMREKSVSLALSSQDLYYSYKLAQLVIKNNKSIKRCIIGAGYYLVNHDLSLSESQDALTRVKNVYYPILNDKHNSEKVDCVNKIHIKTLLNDKVIDFVFNLDFLDSHFKDLVYRRDNSYFNSNWTREMNSMLRGKKLSDINEDDKWKLGECRANQHNKLSKYTKTTKEYNNIFNEFIDFLIDSNVEPIIVVFPNTKYYSYFLNKKYEEEFYRIINGIKERAKIKIVDFSKESIFEEEDFIDLDHMSEDGAHKITSELNRILKTYK